MKHLTHKFAISLLVTSVALPSVFARESLIETPRVVSSAAFELLDLTPPTISLSILLKNTSIVSSEKFELLDLTSPKRSPELLLKDTEEQLSVLGPSGLKWDQPKLNKIHKKLLTKHLKLKAKFDALSESEKIIKLEIAALKMEQEKFQTAERSTWERFKDWVFKLDVTKVASAAIGGLVTVIGILLTILM
jgi:hypothetical protein